MMKKIVGIFVLAIAINGAVMAQETAQQEIESPTIDEAQVQTPAAEVLGAPTEELVEQTDNRPRFNPLEYQSIVFTHWEHVALNDARRSRGSVRPPTEQELMRDLKTREDELEKIKPPPEEREIRLAGIVYRKSNDWTIWLNEERVTPNAIPEEILDLKVYKSYIELKWFDDYTNQIFPIRLRPHQRFNIDARIFLPG